MSGTSISSTSTGVPSFRRRRVIRCARPACHRLPRDLTSLVAVRLAEHEVVDGPAERLFGRLAEELGGGRVPVGHPLVGVHDDHRRGTDRDERLQVLALPLHLGEQARVLDRDADLAAIVASSRESASPNRPSFSMLWTLMTPIAASPRRIGTPKKDRTGVPTCHASCSSNCGDWLSSSGHATRGSGRSAPRRMRSRARPGAARSHSNRRSLSAPRSCSATYASRRQTSRAPARRRVRSARRGRAARRAPGRRC